MRSEFTIAPADPEHRAWGIYRRPKKSPASRSFVLTGICLNHDKARSQTEALTASFPTYDYAVRGAASAAVLPDTCKP